MASIKHQKDLSHLRTTLLSTTSLIAAFQSSLTSPKAAPPTVSNPPNPLRLLLDASTLLKAQTTKLSLLILNTPFTPSAISTIITSISSECLPVLMAALELCRPEEYTYFLSDHIKGNIARILREMSALLQRVPTENDSVGAREGRSTLANTGVIWEICDALIALAKQGVVHLAAQKAETYHALLRDAIAELEKWDPDEEEDDDGLFRENDWSRNETEQQDDTVSPPSVALSAMVLTPPHTPPTTPSPIQMPRNRALSTLRLIRLLYPAIQKRRIHTFPHITLTTTPSDLPCGVQVKAFDALLNHLQNFSEAADVIAGSLYSRDEDDTEAESEKLRSMGLGCVESLSLNWNGAEDKFSAWSVQWSKRCRALAIPTNLS